MSLLGTRYSNSARVIHEARDINHLWFKNTYQPSNKNAAQMKKKGDKRIAKDGTVYLVTQDGPWVKMKKE